MRFSLSAHTRPVSTRPGTREFNASRAFPCLHKLSRLFKYTAEVRLAVLQYLEDLYDGHCMRVLLKIQFSISLISLQCHSIFLYFCTLIVSLTGQRLLQRYSGVLLSGVWLCGKFLICLLELGSPESIESLKCSIALDGSAEEKKHLLLPVAHKPLSGR